MHFNHLYIFLKLSLTLILLIAFVGCNSLLPDEFDGDKKYSSPDIDQKASNIIARDSAGFVINAKGLISLVDDLTAAKLSHDSISEDEVIASGFDALVDSLQSTSLIRDSLLFIEVIDRGASIDTTTSIAYAVLNVSTGQSTDFYLYTSLIYTEANINEYINIQLLKTDASAVSSSNDMVPETITSGTKSIVSSGGDTHLVPIIKARYRVHAEPGVYLVRFIKSDASTLGQYFKLLILSI